MEIAYHSVSGAGPDGATFSEPHVTGTVLVENNLMAGAWTVAADAYNADDVRIGHGEESVAILPAQIAQVEILVRPLAGDGTLDVTVLWAPGSIADPSVSATLTEADGTSHPIAFTTGTGSAESVGNALGAGYYELGLQVLDGGQVVWGVLEVVRILSGQTTSAELRSGVGGLEVTIVPEMDDPIAIALTGQQANLPFGGDMQVTAIPAEAVDSYQWYLNGAAITGATSDTICIGSALQAGSYRLDVRVRKGDIPSSEGCWFVVDVPVTPGSGSAAVTVDMTPSSAALYSRAMASGQTLVSIGLGPELPLNEWSTWIVDGVDYVWLPINVRSGLTYTVRWDDSYEGTIASDGAATYSADIEVGACLSDQVTRVSGWGEDVDSGFAAGMPFSVSVSQTVWIRLRPWGGVASLAGGFGIEVSQSSLPASATTHSWYLDGVTIAGATHRFHVLDPAGLPAGIHRLSAVALRDGAMFSEEYGFTR